MTETLDVFKKFLTDKDEGTMFITGVAGTGKTTSLHELVSYCIDNNIVTLTCAYTHKAVGVLKDKLPKQAAICTLHSYLKKCPTINSNATKVEHVDGNAQVSIPEEVDVLFIDEFSMIGEKDYLDIVNIMYDDNGNIATRIVYIGDPNQLPPVKDMQTIGPSGDYWVKLTKVHRQADDNPLIDTLIKLNSYLNGGKPEPLEEHETFERGYELDYIYNKYKKEHKDASSVILAFTNDRVEELNAQIEGKTTPDCGDTLFSPTLKKSFTLLTRSHYCIEGYIHTIRGEVIEMDSKYKTIESLETLKDIQFYTLTDDNGDETCRPVIFGHGTYQTFLNRLADKAVQVNKKIEKQFKCDAKTWSQDNYKTELAKERAKAWREYMAVKDTVICLDFNHAMTVHKSQGSTYDYVFLDTEDLGKCADKDYTMYSKLMYVGISRASKKVFTN